MKLDYLYITVMLALSFSNLVTDLKAGSTDQSTDNFFSLTEIKKAQARELRPLEYVQASDAVPLAFRSYLPQHAKAVLIFYHGAGAHSGLSYHHLGASLSDDFQVAVYLPDIRGHGGSGGDRGDTPSVDQVWLDVNTLVKQARVHYPKLPIFIGGHSGGSGLALNYSSWDQRAAIDGYVFLAPYFGFRSNTNYDKSQSKFEFSTVRTSYFIVNSISGGKLLGHSKAVTFHYPDSVLKQHPEIVTFNTVNMSNSITPYSPDTQLLDLQKFGLWIGGEDEAFDPLKVVNFAKDNSDDNAIKEIKIIKGENHFSIILRASELIGPWLTRWVE